MHTLISTRVMYAHHEKLYTSSYALTYSPAFPMLSKATYRPNWYTLSYYYAFEQSFDRPTGPTHITS